MADWVRRTSSRCMALRNTSPPCSSWQVGNAVFKISPTFGLTDASYRAMLRFGVQYEISGFRPQAARSCFAETSL